MPLLLGLTLVILDVLVTLDSYTLSLFGTIVKFNNYCITLMLRLSFDDR